MSTASSQLASEVAKTSPLAVCAALQKEYESVTTAEERKERGQIFTPPSVARLMASLLPDIPDHMTLLDPGSGLGTLTAAVCEKVLSLRTARRIEAHLYDTDAHIIPYLERVLKFCESALQAAGHSFSYKILAKDFIVDGPGNSPLWDTAFDAVIMNPPYFKVGVDSPQARSMVDIIRVHTNIYPLFMAKAAAALKPGGSMVSITPRSFCNGLYFRDFRRWFFSRMDLRHIHLFECRRSTFDDVLQESLITLARKTSKHSPHITVSTSLGRDIPADLGHVAVARERVLKKEDDDTLLYIPVSERDAALLELTEEWPDRFSDLGLKVSTGPVVTFRATEFLIPKPNCKPSAPLIAPHNVKPFETAWPLERKNKPAAFLVTPESVKFLVPAKNYVLLRRFTAKEEKRRLVASCFLAESTSGPYVGIENHVNYVYHGHRDLTDDEVFGVAAVLNSALFDSYFRIISGNTQVNATELRTMKFPRLDVMADLGRRVRKASTKDASTVERLVLEGLGLAGRFQKPFEEATS